MFGKLFASMYDGTLAMRGPWQALVTFQQMIVLADRTGIVDMTADALSRRTTIPIEIIETGIAALEKTDDQSRSPDEDGRRIVRLDPNRSWGWQIVNHDKYRKIRSEDERREYMADLMRKRRLEGKGKQKRKQPLAMLAHAEAEADAKVQQDLVPDANASGVPDGTLPDCPHEKLVSLYHEILPECPRVVEWNDARRGYMRSRWREKAKPNGTTQGYRTVEAGLAWWRNFFEYAAQSQFLKGQSQGRDGGPPFVADLEWLIRPKNFPKVVEGKYHR